MAKAKLAQAPSIRRLPSYLHIIQQAKLNGLEYISGTVIANELNLEPIQVRKDLAITGIIGKPKKGYPILELIKAIEKFLGWNASQDAVLVGAGNLGSALLGYSEFKGHGLNIVAAFDQDAQKIGKKIHNVPVFSLSDMTKKLKSLEVKTAILTVPSPFAQTTALLLVEAGIEAIWNFTNVKLKVPAHIIVQREDLTSGWALLCTMMRKQKEDK